jgi:hypothetical protein
MNKIKYNSAITDLNIILTVLVKNSSGRGLKLLSFTTIVDSLKFSKIIITARMVKGINQKVGV